MALAWVLFALVALAVALAVLRLYLTLRNEVTERSTRAREQLHERAVASIVGQTDAARHGFVKALAGFHLEGLGHALRQWDEANPAVVGTFQWDAERGFLPGSTTNLPQVRPEEVPRLWEQFGARRGGLPREQTAALGQVGGYLTQYYRTIDNPLFPAAELGYQAENLDILAYGGKPVEPWAGWAGNSVDPAAPWIFWYQPARDAPVRGCFVDIAPLLARLRAEFADRRLARVDLVPVARTTAAGARGDRSSLAIALPGFALSVAEGDLFAEKQSSARLAAIAVVLLLGVFLVGIVFLAMFSRREAVDAQRKTTFVTQVSHELRTPLTSIRMFADMLAAPKLPEPKRARYAATISRESERLTALIERLLMFNTLATGRPAPATAPVDVTALVRETLEEMDATLQAAGMRAEPDLPAHPAIATTDRSTLKQALLNLIDNALKYARDGKVIFVNVTPGREDVRVRVADCGAGIPRALGERVFEPFVQGGQTLSDKSPGVGLGLSIARGLLRQAGGDLVLLPSDTGALFEIRLPAAAPAT